MNRPRVAIRSWSQAGALAFGPALITVVSFADGGYFRSSWLGTTLALCAIAGVLLLLRPRIELGGPELAVLGAAAALVGWIALSATWSTASTSSLQEAERDLIYLAAVVALLLLVDRGNVPELLGGIALSCAVVSGYTLEQRLVAHSAIAQDPISGTRLLEPLGYANALGIMAAVGTTLALGLAVHAETRTARAVFGALPVVVLPALVLTESRGAALALIVGLGTLVLVEPRRRRVIAGGVALVGPCAVAVLSTLFSSALTSRTATARDITESGHRLAFVLLAALLASGLAALAVDRIEMLLERPLLGRIAPTALGLSVVAIAVVAVVAVDRALGPRVDYWRVAWNEYLDHPLLGSGAGTYFQFWQREQTPIAVRDAHSLYVETLAELGLLGVLLLVVAFGTPLVVALRGRDRRYTAVAGAAFVTYLVHAGLDWDWEMPAVTLAGLGCGIAALVGGRPESAALAVSPLGRRVLGLGVGSVALAAVLLHFTIT